ncbi:MAG: ribonuclease HII [Pseudomonadota bacterium]
MSHEEALFALGKSIVCGVDEVGRGPLAGPVVAAAVVLNPKAIPAGLNDSKAITEKKRGVLYQDIMASARVAVCGLNAKLIDRLNIRAASLLAMQRAISGLEIAADHALIDGNAIPPGLRCGATTLVKGDARSCSIAAASIVAKVTRDAMMVRADRYYPQYGFAGHKGYPTKSHREALTIHGPCPLHRRSFAPVRNTISEIR